MTLKDKIIGRLLQVVVIAVFLSLIPISIWLHNSPKPKAPKKPSGVIWDPNRCYSVKEIDSLKQIEQEEYQDSQQTGDEDGYYDYGR